MNKLKRNNFLLLFCLLFSVCCYGQINSSGASGLPATDNRELKGVIKNYALQPIRLYKCYGDTLLLTDSALTDKKGQFSFSKKAEKGLYKIFSPQGLYFFIINDGNPVEIKTVFSSNASYNSLSDSLIVVKSSENKMFYNFQRLQVSANVNAQWIVPMMRLFPLSDPFHKQIEAEYFKRNEEIKKFMLARLKEHARGPAAKIALAYYKPVQPDWKEPDPDRNLVFEQHYFDYFNPADSFYMHTNILSEKIEEWFSLHSNPRESGDWNEKAREQAADTFLLKSSVNIGMTEGDQKSFILNYILKKLNKEHNDNALLYVYDRYVKPEEGNCESSNNTFNWIRESVNKLRNIQIGTIAPDFALQEGRLNMLSLESDYTLLVFWASWCPHCAQMIPQLKKVTDAFNKQYSDKKSLISIGISLDTDEAAWQKYVEQNGLYTWLNVSELKGWKGEVPGKYNVYATPTLFLLNREKKIIAKPETPEELSKLLDVKSN